MFLKLASIFNIILLLQFYESKKQKKRVEGVCKKEDSNLIGKWARAKKTYIKQMCHKVFTL